MSELQPIELENSAGEFKPPVDDKRPKMPEPLPVKIVAVADVRLPAQAGLEKEMDGFYCGLLGFQRVEGEEALVYQADNFRVCFELIEGLIHHESYRPLQVEIASLGELERALIEAETQYVRQRGLLPGSECLLLRDPSGNWVELVERREVR
jgi:catechol-2,3-dioxygenase